MAQHWSVHGVLATFIVAVAVAGYIWQRTPADRWGIQGFAAFALVTAYGLTYMAGI